MSPSDAPSPARPRDRKRPPAKLGRTRHPPATRGAWREDGAGPHYLYGLHTVAAALANPQRRSHRLHATRNARAKLEAEIGPVPVPIVEASPRAIDALLGSDAVHQGVALEVDPLEPVRPDALTEARLVLALDQITDPHNVGAILRSAVALGADAVLTTARHAPRETGVLAKAASGALDRITLVEATNLSRALQELQGYGFTAIALDSAGDVVLDELPRFDKVVIVLGAEGKGVRAGVKATCDRVARIDLPGSIRSLNVSNAAVLALYILARASARGDRSA